MAFSPKVPIFKNSETICIPGTKYRLYTVHMFLNLWKWNNTAFISEVHFFFVLELSIIYDTEGPRKTRLNLT